MVVLPSCTDQLSSVFLAVFWPAVSPDTGTETAARCRKSFEQERNRTALLVQTPAGFMVPRQLPRRKPFARTAPPPREAVELQNPHRCAIFGILSRGLIDNLSRYSIPQFASSRDHSDRGRLRRLQS